MERYGFLHTEIEGQNIRVYKPVTTNDLYKAHKMYEYFENKNYSEGMKHEIAIFDYQKFVYIKHNFDKFSV